MSDETHEPAAPVVYDWTTDDVHIVDEGFTEALMAAMTEPITVSWSGTTMPPLTWNPATTTTNTPSFYFPTVSVPRGGIKYSVRRPGPRWRLVKRTDDE